MRATEIMAREVPTCHAHDALAIAAQAMWTRDRGVVAVVDETERVIGVVTERDVWMVASMKGGPLSDIVVSSAMSSEVKTCAPDATASEIDRIMQPACVRVLVVDSLGHVVGVISRADLALALARDRSRGDTRPRAFDIPQNGWSL